MLVICEIDVYQAGGHMTLEPSEPREAVSVLVLGHPIEGFSKAKLGTPQEREIYARLGLIGSAISVWVTFGDHPVLFKQASNAAVQLLLLFALWATVSHDEPAPFRKLGDLGAEQLK